MATYQFDQMANSKETMTANVIPDVTYFGNGDEEERGIKISYSYPNNPDFDYISYLERINFDEEMKEDIRTGNGFIIHSPKGSLKKDIKNEDGIYSPKFGQRLGDLNPFMDRWRCACGKWKSRMRAGEICPFCRQPVVEVGDNFHMFGWINITDEYALIHPNIYKELETFFGRSKYSKERKDTNKLGLKNMLNYDKIISQDGYDVGNIEKNGEPFYGIGMIEFHERFNEIMEFYRNKFKNNKKKMDMYNDIMNDYDKIFIHNIPVYTTQLRPIDIHSETMYYEKNNGIYNMMVRLAQAVNKNKRKIDRSPKLKNEQLYSLQVKLMDLYDEIVNILNGKRGELRMLVSGRFNYSSRCVIRQDPSLRIDQVILPYTELIIAYEQQIINILMKTYNITPDDAWGKWHRAITKKDPTIYKILEDLIHANPEGLPVIINRNPTISYGSILQSFCVGISDSFTMSVPLTILPPLAADFDGDILNIFHIISEPFFLRAFEVFNPRNAMYLSRDNGMANKQVFPQRDTIINAQALNDISYGFYTPEEIEHINRLKNTIYQDNDFDFS